MTGEITLLLLTLAFFTIALLYSSVGFGGGSSYLAILSLYTTDFLQIKTAALLCNLVVVAAGSYLFYKEGLFDKKRFLSLALFSVPAAFLGATIHLTQVSFFIFLGAILSLSGLLLILQLFLKGSEEIETRNNSIFVNIFLGGSTGFLSGLVGIGGGILLSPILNLLKWDRPKKIAALASFFILVNSVAGLLGQAASKTLHFRFPLFFLLLAAVFVGGQIGTRLNIRLLKPQLVKGLTGVLVLYIGIKLILKYSLSIDI
ncbi:MAG TPA: sulfite exporter TauE/SafE family protein [Segetibacter sp.]|jgi:hypothetical protein